MSGRRDTILQHLDYHVWATELTLDSVEPLSSEALRQDLTNSFGGIWGTLEHIYKADAIWLKRHQGDGHATLDGAARVNGLADLRGKWSAVQRSLRQYAEGLGEEDWGRPLHYHRGQIVTMMRQIGAKPVSTDFIRYVWQKAPHPAKS